MGRLEELAEILKPVLDNERGSIATKEDAQDFLKLFRKLEDDVVFRETCCGIVSRTNVKVLAEIQSEIVGTFVRWLDEAVKADKPPYNDPTERIIKLVPALRKLRPAWARMGASNIKRLGRLSRELLKAPADSKVYKRTEPLSHDLIEMMDAKEHKAADNETMMMIADLYGVDVDELVKLNKQYKGVTRGSRLEENTLIKLPSRDLLAKDAVRDKPSSSRSSASTQQASASADPPISPTRTSSGSLPAAAPPNKSAASVAPKTSADEKASSTHAASARAGKQPAKVVPSSRKIVKSAGSLNVLSSLGKSAPSAAAAAPHVRPGARRPSTDTKTKPPPMPLGSHLPPSAAKISVLTTSDEAGPARINSSDSNSSSSAATDTLSRKRAADDDTSYDAQPTKKAKKSVRWGDNWSPNDRSLSTTAWKDTGPGLTQIREIERASSLAKSWESAKLWEARDERDHKRELHSPAPADELDEDDNSEKSKRIQWTRPTPYAMPTDGEPDTYLEPDRRGADSDEKIRQEMREQKVLQAQYLYEESIPSSAQEPEDESDRQPSKDAPTPVVIPLVFGVVTPAAANGDGAGMEPVPQVAPPMHEGAALALFGNDVLTALIKELAERPEVLKILGRGPPGGHAAAAYDAHASHQPYGQGHYQSGVGYGTGSGYHGGSSGWDSAAGSAAPPHSSAGGGRQYSGSGGSGYGPPSDSREDSHHYSGGGAPDHYRGDVAKHGEHGGRDNSSRYHGAYSSSSSWRN